MSHMKPTDIIPALLRDGAALTLFPQGEAPRTLLLDAAHVITSGTLICYEVGGGVHRLDFEELRASHGLAVEFLSKGQVTAYLTTVAEDGEESVAAWQAWQAHLSTQRVAHTEAVAAEMRDFTGEED